MCYEAVVIAAGVGSALPFSSFVSVGVHVLASSVLPGNADRVKTVLIDREIDFRNVGMLPLARGGPPPRLSGIAKPPHVPAWRDFSVF